MKNVQKLFYAIVALMAVATSCEEEKHDLGTLPSKADIKYSVTQDLVKDPGGNTILLKDNTPGTIAMWDYGTGRSTREADTIHFPFKGTYVINFSAVTGAGIVTCDPITVNVTADNYDYISDPLWVNLSGGPGNEKTWILDINSTHFDGPLYFDGTNMGWQGVCQVSAGDCWNWNASYKDNSWIMPSGDYGTMKFSLKGGPFVTVDHLMIPDRGTESGTYYLDPTTKKLSLTDATPLHDKDRDGCVAGWGDITLFSLTETTMQFGVMRTSCDGPCFLVYNYYAAN